MAFNLSPSLMNRFESTFNDETIIYDGQMINSFDHHSISSLNHVNENGMIINQPIHSNPNVVTTGSHHQNGLIYQSSYIGYDQIGFSQRATEVRRVIIGQNRVQIHSIIDYEFQVQNQIALPPISTPSQFLPSTSALEPFLAPNNIHQNQVNIPNNDIASPVPRVIAIESGENSSHQQTRTMTRQEPNLGELGRSHVRAFGAVNNQTALDNDMDDSNFSDDDDDDDDIQEYDGRTHSLPHRKKGPYTCPKCRGVFETSQSFAAHMSSHYKYETSAQRKFRLSARFNKMKKLQFVSTSEGLTLAPIQHVTEDPTRVPVQGDRDGQEVKEVLEDGDEDRGGIDGPTRADGRSFQSG